MFYTLDRTEDNNIAVLIDDDGRIYNVSANILSDTCSVGDVFVCKDGKYIFDAQETALRRARIAQKRNRFFSKIKNNKEDLL
ncbi:MAG: DUF3006 domain-containing protein [Clostridia bacterium]|nr:DUF3006 domain-containing protein [Clostridia bacterium]